MKDQYDFSKGTRGKFYSKDAVVTKPPIFEFQCCFCGEVIERGGGTDGTFDPAALIVVGHWQEERSKQLEQQFFCHIECLKAKMHPPHGIDIDRMAPGAQA